jgi:hypothetical protein
MDALKDYTRPRDKVTKLLRDRIIIRVKKGLYIRNNVDPSALHVRELLANLIYGPSYISLQYALSSYGMIPEEVIQLSSLTFKKTKRYRTPIGDFLYRSVPLPYYLHGVELKSTNEGYFYLIASPEKALMDTLYFTTGLRSMRDVRVFLMEDLRIDESSLLNFDFSLLDEITEAAGTSKAAVCRRALESFTR